MLNTLEIFGWKFHQYTVYDLISYIMSQNTPTIIVTPNIDHIVRASKDSQLKELYLSADICLNDSRVFSYIVDKFINLQLSALTGSDLTRKLLEMESIDSFKLAVVGAESYQIDYLRKNIVKQGLIEHYNPPIEFYRSNEEIQQAIEFMLKADADIIFLAVGSPQQEILAHKIKPLLTKGVILCVGASIDYLTGKEKRAPEWLQNLNMEWFYRFLQSPTKRFKRYFINCPQIFYLLCKERQRLRKMT